ncbi:hypothetical protein K8I28_14915, partial [bacterium]|nr:hypothetical protein [bacterium]
MLLANSSDFTDAEWESFSSTKNWQLLTGEGRKDVYLRVIQAIGDTSEVVHGAIDPAPINPNVGINNDEETTTTRIVMLSLSAVGATEMQISNQPPADILQGGASPGNKS